MYHSIAFENKNTWDDFHLVPSSKPIILPPEIKTKTVDIPGGDGVIDLTESLTGYPVFGNREGSFSFIVANNYMQIMDQDISWEETYKKVLSYFHGRKMRLVLEDDPKWYYEGRLAISDPKQYRAYSAITLEYNLGPYKWSLRDSTNIVTYDPFNAFINVPADTTFTNLAVGTTAQTYTFDEDDLGTAPISPSFVVSSTAQNGVKMTYTNSSGETDEIDIPDGTYTVNDLIFYRDASVSFRCTSGTATVTIKFRKGML